MRYASFGHCARFVGDPVPVPHGEFKLEYQGPMGEYERKDFNTIERHWFYAGWKVEIGQMDDNIGEFVISDFHGESSIRTDYFTLIFTRGPIRMSVSFDVID